MGSLYFAKVDLLNKTTQRYAEIKPLSVSGITAGLAQLSLRKIQFARTGYTLDVSWVPSTKTGIALGQPFVFVNVGGLVLYSDLVDLAQDIIAISSAALARQFVAKYTLHGAIAAIRGLVGARIAIDNVRLDSHISIGTLLAVLGKV